MQVPVFMYVKKVNPLGVRSLDHLPKVFPSNICLQINHTYLPLAPSYYYCMDIEFLFISAELSNENFLIDEVFRKGQYNTSAAVAFV